VFIPNSNQLKEFDLNKARQFVGYWGELYSYDSVKCFNTEEKIEYIKELNIGYQLTENNIKRLLRWKDPMMLTEKILSGPYKGRANPRVSKVLDSRESINEFREGNSSKEEFKKVTKEIFPNGFVWQVFLFHIARPFEFPIADRNVFQSFSVQKQTKLPGDWEGYQNYVDYFFQIAIAANIISEKPKGDEPNLKDIVRELKKVDNALFIFGQFLNSYGKAIDIKVI